jgi:uroporphyrinogen decarboxylase
MPIKWAVDTLGDGANRPCLQGNLDPVALLVGGQAMLDEAADIIEGFGGNPFVFNLGHGVLPQTDPDEVQRLTTFLRSVRL